jgi:hypothetical protein
VSTNCNSSDNDNDDNDEVTTLVNQTPPVRVDDIELGEVRLLLHLF